MIIVSSHLVVNQDRNPESRTYVLDMHVSAVRNGICGTYVANLSTGQCLITIAAVMHARKK